MGKKLIAVFALIAAAAFAYRHYTSEIKLAIENGNLAFLIQKQSQFTSLTRIFIKSADGKQYIPWDYQTTGDVYFSKLALPRKITFGKNPFAYPPAGETKLPLKDGRYTLSLVVNTWDNTNPQKMVLIGNEQIIRAEFCIQHDKAGKLALC